MVRSTENRNIPIFQGNMRTGEVENSSKLFLTTPKPEKKHKKKKRHYTKQHSAHGLYGMYECRENELFLGGEKGQN